MLVTSTHRKYLGLVAHEFLVQRLHSSNVLIDRATVTLEEVLDDKGQRSIRTTIVAQILLVVFIAALRPNI